MSADLTSKLYVAGDWLRSEAFLGNLPDEPAAHNDCVPIAVINALTALGYPEVDPQQVINWIFGGGSSAPGGTNFYQVWAYFQQAAGYANLPATSILPADVPSLAAALNQGWPVIIYGQVDCASVEFVAGGACLHASNLTYIDDATATVINCFWNRVETYPTAALLASLQAANCLQRSVLPSPPPPQEVDVMPVEVPLPPIPVPAGLKTTIEVAYQLNTSFDRVYARLRSTGFMAISGTFVAVDSISGTPVASQSLTAPAGGASRDWQLPDGLDCNLVFQPNGDGAGAVSIKVGTKTGAPTST